ncbi:hypothetical protein E2C05_02815 [Paracraurococcus ruber]|nr:hypothetical protein E2C05_02815 [Paracraurococcus ruber]
MLSEAERALWQLYTARAQVAPLPGKALPPPPAPPTAAATAPASPPAAVPVPKPAAAHRGVEVQIGAQPAGLDQKRWKSLRRGETRPERTLDLHGRRAQDAHAAVRRFLHQAQAEGLRCVAIVTGKGSMGQEMGVLRRELPHWLNAPDLRPLILGAAHYAAGNPGAVVLLLRRPRAPR